jgi:hypothetical protein
MGPVYAHVELGKIDNSNLLSRKIEKQPSIKYRQNGPDFISDPLAFKGKSNEICAFILFQFPLVATGRDLSGISIV